MNKGNGAQTSIVLLMDSLRKRIEGPDKPGVAKDIHEDLLNLVLITNAKSQEQIDKLKDVCDATKKLQEQSKENTQQQLDLKALINNLTKDMVELKTAPTVLTYAKRSPKTTVFLILLVLFMFEIWVELVVTHGYSVIDILMKFV